MANAGTSDKVTILLGNGSGGFPTSSTVGTGNIPISVAVGDFNGDGNQDLAVANFGSHNVTILLGDGSGGFTQAVGSPVGAGTNPDFVAVGDFNGDGRQDLAVVNSNGNVTILLGDGLGVFTPAVGSPFVAGNFPQSVAVGDFNGDGNQDLAVANANSHNVTILLGNGSGAFTQAVGSPVGAGTNPDFVAVGDFNGDGKQDLAVANRGSNNVTILLGNGSGGFTQLAGSPFGAGGNPNSVAVGDFNGNGRQDLAVANYGSNDVTILLNTCTNSAPTISAVPVTRQQGSPAANSTIANVNDAEDAENTLTVKVNGGSSATVTGVTVSSISVDSAGVVTANVVAACGASNADFTLRVTDSGGLFAEATLTVTVNPDNQSPTINCAAVPAQSAEADANCSAPVPDVRALVRAQSSDNCTAQASLTVTQNPAQGTTVSGVSSHPITVTVTDAANNSVNCTVAFTVNDHTKPTIACPANLTVTANLGSSSALVSYSAPAASDNCGVPTVGCSQASGSSFPVGTTTVVCTATDSAGNTGQCSFMVTVLTPQGAIQQLADRVNSLVSQGVLTKAQGNSLTSKLQAAITQLNDGKGDVARKQLQAFINEVKGYVSTGKLTAAQGQALIDAANDIIAHIP